MVVREKSAGAIVYRESQGKILYLLLKYNEGHWDFPKGHVEKGETELQTMQREVREETALTDLKVIGGFRRTISYYYKREGTMFFKEVVFFLAKTETEQVTVSHEHLDHEWLQYDDALKKATYRSAQNLLMEAQNFISPKFI